MPHPIQVRDWLSGIICLALLLFCAAGATVRAAERGAPARGGWPAR